MQVRSVLICSCWTVLLALLFAGCGGGKEPEFSSRKTLTAGIFLDLEERFSLEPGVSLRKVNNRGIELTKLSEGFEPKLYNDAANYCTIAYGHLIKLAPCNGTEPAEFRNGVTRVRGTEILRGDMSNAERAVMALVDVELNDDQYAALCDFVFNVGSGNFSSSTLRKVVNAEDFDSVPAQLRRWRFAGGKEFKGLITRRENEIDLFFRELPMPRMIEELPPIDIRTGETE